MPNLADLEAVLHHDPRPTFILDLHTPTTIDAKRIVSRNRAYLLEKEKGDSTWHEDTEGFTQFLKWASSPKEIHYTLQSAHAVWFNGLQWDYYTIEERWRIVSASARDNSKADGPWYGALARSEQESNGSHEYQPVDYFRGYNPSLIYPQHVKYMRNFNWAATSLGPMETWPDQLIQMCNFLVADQNRAIIFWGEKYTIIHNEPGAAIFTQLRQSSVMGLNLFQALPEVLEYFEPLCDGVMATAQVVRQEDVRVVGGVPWVEEHFFTYTFLPLVGNQGKVCGIYETVTICTNDNMNRRRIPVLRALHDEVEEAEDLHQLWPCVLKAMESSGFDLPSVLIYSLSEDSNDKRRVLQGSLGVPQDRISSAERIHVFNETTGIDRFSALLMAGSTSTDLQYHNVEEVGLPTTFFNGSDGRGDAIPSTQIAILPVRISPAKGMVFLVIGLNPRIRIESNPQYNDFLLTVQLAIKSAVASLVQKEHRIELEAADQRFVDFAKVIPLGVIVVDSNNRILFTNDEYHRLSGVRKVPLGSTIPDDYFDLIHPDDAEMVKGRWAKLIETGHGDSYEMRVKRPWRPPDGSEEVPFTWLLHAISINKRNGSLHSIMNCVTDISQQKYAEAVQMKRVEDALQAKKNLDEFIDMTSHEMRNPLSAILQCSDEIVTSLEKYRKTAKTETVEVLGEMIHDILDAGETIYYCCQHQSRIADDVLVLSKLSSGLLPVSPSIVQPALILGNGLKMYEREARVSDIKLSLTWDPSYELMDWACLDIGRTRQILFNIVGNAMKFVKTERQREIKIVIYAFHTPPPGDHDPKVHYLPPSELAHDPTNQLEWGSGKEVFMEVTVQDTGPGLTKEESERMFQRFSQANRRTHVTYGGSGLGLYICKNLAEMHGGRVGFSSSPGEGSIFGFFVKCRQAPPGFKPEKLLESGVKGAPQRATQENSTLPDNTIASLQSLEPKESPVEKKDPAGKYNILIVEDNITNQRVLARSLSRHGHTVNVVGHGREALDYIEKTRAWTAAAPDAVPLDIVLSDMEMPVMDGLEFVKEVRRLQEEKAITEYLPVVAITGNARDEQVKTAKEAGMDEVVLKPFQIRVLAPLMEKLVERSTQDRVES